MFTIICAFNFGLDFTLLQAARTIEESFRLQQDLLEGQEKAIAINQELVANSSYLTQAIKVGRDSVRHMLTEFRLTTTEQKNLIFEVFDRVSRLQNLVLSEVNWLYTVVYYGACLVVIYVVTATKQTADARLWLFVLVSLNLGLERAVCRWSLPSDGLKVCFLLYQR
jgi:hypothetical protein